MKTIVLGLKGLNVDFDVETQELKIQLKELDIPIFSEEFVKHMEHVHGVRGAEVRTFELGDDILRKDVIDILKGRIE